MVIPKIHKPINPTLVKNSEKEICAYEVIRIFGIEEIGNNIPPILTKMASAMIQGAGLIFKIREIVMVMGIITMIAKMLLIIAEITTERKPKTKSNLKGFPPLN